MRTVVSGSVKLWCHLTSKLHVCSAFSPPDRQNNWADQKDAQNIVCDEPMGSNKSLIFLTVENCTVSTFF